MPHLVRWHFQNGVLVQLPALFLLLFYLLLRPLEHCTAFPFPLHAGRSNVRGQQSDCDDNVCKAEEMGVGVSVLLENVFEMGWRRWLGRRLGSVAEGTSCSVLSCHAMSYFL